MGRRLPPHAQKLHDFQIACSTPSDPAQAETYPSQCRRALPLKERPDGIDIAPMADFFLCDGLPRPIPKTGFSTSLRPAVTLDDRPPRDNGNLAHDPQKWPPVFRKDHAPPRCYRVR